MSAALITGSSHRIGRQIALECARMGYDIALHCCRSFKLALETQKMIEEYGVQVRIFEADLMVQEELAFLIPKVVETFPQLDLLVNNASVFERKTLLQTSFLDFDQNFNLHLKAPFFLSLFFARACCEKKSGHIINILDSKVARNDISYLTYTLSKKALANLTLMSAKELAPRIRVNGIAPGYVLPPVSVSEEYLLQRPKNIPLQAQGSPDYVIQSLQFLIQNPFVTGQILFVDGGEHL